MHQGLVRWHAAAGGCWLRTMTHVIARNSEVASGEHGHWPNDRVPDRICSV